MKLYIIVFITLILLPIISGNAQTVLKGHIRDAKTNVGLPAANIQIEGTYQGTITNEDGEFYLLIEDMPTTLLISYIGYETQRLIIRDQRSGHILIKLDPIILEMDAIVVIAEDPAMEIMRKVIERKLEWRKNINTYTANAYSRLVFENDSGIVSIAESLSKTFWDKQKGSREVVISKRQTSNLSEEQNFAVASFIPNFYDDDINIVGYQVIGPTHPDALDYYKYKLIKERKIDDKTVYDIQVIPDSKLQPTFEGMLAVLDEDFAVLNVDLQPSNTIKFPAPVQELNLHYLQQFRGFADSTWLPVDFRVYGDVKIGFIGLQFPTIKYNRITALSNYDVNVQLPDSLYENESVLSVDSLSLKQDTLFAASKIIIPLTIEEDSAYTSLDSTMTLQKAFKPTGFLADIIEVTSGDSDEEEKGGKSIFSYLSPQLWYNRVDGLHAGLTVNYNISGNLGFKIGAAYKSGLKKWGYNSEIEYSFGKSNQWIGLLQFEEGTDSRYPSETYSLTLASFPPLFGRDDYFDYFWRKKLSFSLGYKISMISTKIMVGVNSEKHQSVAKTTDFNLFGTSFKQRENPDINNGILRSIRIFIQYGGDYIPFGVVGQKRVSISIEKSDPSLISSDFSFTKYDLSFDWRIKTFLTRRFLPNVFDFHISAGYSTGSLPLQKYGIVDGSFDYFTSFGTLKSRRPRPYEGEQYFAMYWEHNFRTVPFELINFNFLVDKGIGIIVFGAHGRSWISDDTLAQLSFRPAYTNKFHHEFGLSVNSIFSLLRVDTSYRIDSKAFYVGLSMARFF